MTLRHLVEPELSNLAIELDGEPVPGLRMTEKQFHEWYWRTENTRAEWVNGEVILLSPINIPEFRLNLWLFELVRAAAGPDGGEVFGIEVQIRLPSVKQRRNPDVLFVSRSREKMIKHTYIDGPPDLVMEIVSPDSQNRDRRQKYLGYEKSGVREYWIIDPQTQRVDAYALGRDKKYHTIRELKGRIHSKVLRKLLIRPEWLWKSPLPKLATVLKELRIRS
jgi:Uma2 family endonuclease